MWPGQGCPTQSGIIFALHVALPEGGGLECTGAGWGAMPVGLGRRQTAKKERIVAWRHRGQELDQTVQDGGPS